LISFDPETQIPLLIQIYTDFTLAYGLGEEISYNFAAIEQYLMDQVLSGKPFIDLELRKFSFANEARMSGALTAVRHRIPQIELTPELKDAIAKELSESPQLLQACLQALEVVVGFLSSMGGTHVRSLPTHLFLTEYMKETLFFESSSLFATKTVSKHVQLQHILSLWKILDESLCVDPFANVSSKFKSELNETEESRLTDVASFLDLRVLVPALKEFMLNYLGENTSLGPDYVLKDIIGEYSDPQGTCFSDMDWFDQYFPGGDLLLRHIHAVYLILTKASAAR